VRDPILIAMVLFLLQYALSIIVNKKKKPQYIIEAIKTRKRSKIMRRKKQEKMTDEQKKRIDALSHYELCLLWKQYTS